MSVLSRLFGSESTDDYLDRQAATLVSTAQVLATGSYVQFAEQIPIINKISTDDWDFFLTVGGVFVAATALHQMGLPESVEEGLMESVARDLEGWDPNGIRAFEDCKQLFENTYDALSKLDEYRRDERLLGADSVGLWIAWNLLGHRPQVEEEQKLLRLVGIDVTHAFVDWWNPS